MARQSVFNSSQGVNSSHLHCLVSHLFMGLLIILPTAICGCGQEGLVLLPVEVDVALNGKPVEGAAVVLSSNQGGYIAHGVTDELGRCQLETTNRVGIVAGGHRVAITKSNIRERATQNGLTLDIDWIIPEKYSQSETSGLTLVADAENLEFKFDLVFP